MLVKGDIKCLHCGHISGEWVGASGAPLTSEGLRSHDKPADPGPAVPLRCVRCEGPVLLDAAALVISSYRLRRIQRLRDQIAALDARRNRAA